MDEYTGRQAWCNSFVVCLAASESERGHDDTRWHGTFPALASLAATDRQADNTVLLPGGPGGVGRVGLGETWAEWNLRSRKYIQKIKLRHFFTQPTRPWKLGLSGIAQLNIRLAGGAGS